jgi:uncharacterized protein YdeI (YjbR/CyaY-like superfamily)
MSMLQSQFKSKCSCKQWIPSPVDALPIDSGFRYHQVDVDGGVSQSRRPSRPSTHAENFAQGSQAHEEIFDLPDVDRFPVSSLSGILRLGMEPKFFATPADWRRWLEQHHGEASELLVGFYKKGSGKPSITWPESVDGALCFGWIDGVRRSIDEESYSIRFTPRRARSIWSAVNIKRVAELRAQDLMHPAGVKAFEARHSERSGVYSFEQKTIEFDREQEKKFKADKAAWKFFQAQAPWYRRTAMWWVISAKRDETRARRLATLIEDSAAGRTIGPLTRPGVKTEGTVDK